MLRFIRKLFSPAKPRGFKIEEVADPYWDSYEQWKSRQVCLGCNRKSCTMEPGEEKWITEYLCTPCWEKGVRGRPHGVFNGYTGKIEVVK